MAHLGPSPASPAPFEEWEKVLEGSQDVLAVVRTLRLLRIIAFFVARGVLTLRSRLFRRDRPL